MILIYREEFKLEVEECIENILEFKDYLYDEYKREKSEDRVEYYIELLTSDKIKRSFPDLTKCNNNESYVKHYLNACLISCYMEKEGYNLACWNEVNDEIFKILKEDDIYKSYLGGADYRYFEVLILHIINKVFKLDNIIALRANNDRSPNKLYDDYNKEVFDKSTINKIIDKLKINMKIRGEKEKKVWGDNDIIVIAYPQKRNNAEAICIISCKTSLRERVYQSVFWATHSRIEGIAKHTFATLDKGNKGKSEIKGRDEESNVRKTRDVLESTMERVYVFRNKDEVNRSYVIKDFEYLKKDLIRWREDYFGL